MKRLNIFLISIFLITFLGCEDFLDKSPFDIITDDIVITNLDDAEAALLGAYDALQSGDMYGNQAIGTPGVLSDELIHSGSFPTVAEFDNNFVLPNNVTLQNLWAAYYRGLYRANVILERVPPISGNETLKNQILGEALFLRALFHFDLVKLFGGIPYANTTDLSVLRTLDRTPVEDVYTNVIADLNEAITLLAGVSHGNNNRANEWVAKALLARVHLYVGNLSQAGTLANDVIENGPYSLEANYIDVFQGGSDEVLFEVFFSVQDQNGLAFWFREDGRWEYAPSPELIAAFEPGDVRAGMIQPRTGGGFQAAKYTDRATGTDQTPILRLAEMYLIRAEANIASNPTQAIDDVNVIRNRAGLGDVTSVDINTILQERFVEFCFEGHRWYDLNTHWPGRCGYVSC
ncbi:MAG: membrane protein [Cyclobacteriaceae bacterium]|nr:MAG: membrane protein [Cyclobacteriaceae bacterium]